MSFTFTVLCVFFFFFADRPLFLRVDHNMGNSRISASLWREEGVISAAGSAGCRLTAPRWHHCKYCSNPKNGHVRERSAKVGVEKRFKCSCHCDMRKIHYILSYNFIIAAGSFGLQSTYLVMGGGGTTLQGLPYSYLWETRLFYFFFQKKH